MPSRWSELVSMDSAKGNHAWPTWLLSMMGQLLDRWGESSGYCLPWLQEGFRSCLTWYPHRQVQEVQTKWVDSELDWELAERWIPELQSVTQDLAGGLSQAVSLKGQYWAQCCLICSSVIWTRDRHLLNKSLMTQGREQWPIPQSAALTGWRDGQKRTVWNSPKAK